MTNLTPGHLPASSDTPALAVDIQAGRKGFGNRRLFSGLDLQIAQNEFVALLGASGSGKTTLLRIILGLDTFDSGTGQVATPRSAVFQEPRLVPSQRVWENVLMGRRRTRALRQLALETLGEVGLSTHAYAWPATLSGGEAQRVALARALIARPALLLLDEPFAALDALTRIRMHGLVKALVKKHRPGVLLVTHDVDEAIRLADRIVVLRDGEIAFDERISSLGTVETAYPAPASGTQTPATAADTTAAFTLLRQRLYAELGVVRDAAITR